MFAFGEPGPPRSTPDYYAIQVMNNLLGGLFQSRLNHDIREVKGYSYGVNSGFAYGRGPGAFRAGGGIVSAKTDSALIGFMTHFKGVQGEMPFTDDEVTVGKESLIQSLPGRFCDGERNCRGHLEHLHAGSAGDVLQGLRGEDRRGDA